MAPGSAYNPPHFSPQCCCCCCWPFITCSLQLPNPPGTVRAVGEIPLLFSLIFRTSPHCPPPPHAQMFPTPPSSISPLPWGNIPITSSLAINFNEKNWRPGVTSPCIRVKCMVRVAEQGPPPPHAPSVTENIY